VQIINGLERLNSRGELKR